MRLVTSRQGNRGTAGNEPRKKANARGNYITLQNDDFSLRCKSKSCKLCAGDFQNWKMNKIDPLRAMVFIGVCCLIAILISTTQTLRRGAENSGFTKPQAPGLSPPSLAPTPQAIPARAAAAQPTIADRPADIILLPPPSLTNNVPIGGVIHHFLLHVNPGETIHWSQLDSHWRVSAHYDTKTLDVTLSGANDVHNGQDTEVKFVPWVTGTSKSDRAQTVDCDIIRVN